MNTSELNYIAKYWRETFDEYMSWINDPESHMETYREPGASYFREVEQRYKRAEARFVEALKGTNYKIVNDKLNGIWPSLSKIAYEVIANE